VRLLAGLLVLASAASAPLAPPGELLGGGAIPENGTYGLHFVTVRVTPDGRRVKFYGDWNGACEGFTGAVTASFFKIAAIAKDGSFKGRGPLDSAVAAGPFSFQGTFTSPASAAGTGSVHFTFTPGPGRSYLCDTGTVAWQVRADRPLRGSPRPRPGAAYYGNTSQDLPFVLRVSPDGRSVVQAALLWNATCAKSKAGLSSATFTPTAPISQGAFSTTQRYTDAKLSGRVVSTDTGRFGQRAAAGTWHIHVDVVARRGGIADTCDSDRISWKARP
jgi:hypothetical protein